MSSTDPQSTCPVDEKARQAWLDAAQQQRQSQTQNSQDPNSATPKPRFTSTRPTQKLSTARQVSSIPRARSVIPTSTASNPDAPSCASPNSQNTDPMTSRDGRWMYPSESQFFAAMARKKHDPQAADMSSVIPIHNAVNERTWHEIKAWEAGRGAERCGGPKLLSFSGDSKKLTPRARWNTLIGYERPFDRHDWVVDRCGTSVEYVIDFYAGKKVEGVEGKTPLSFYLDVRPKLNSFEGCKMRINRFIGL